MEPILKDQDAREAAPVGVSLRVLEDQDASLRVSVGTVPYKDNSRRPRLPGSKTFWFSMAAFISLLIIGSLAYLGEKELPALHLVRTKRFGPMQNGKENGDQHAAEPDKNVGIGTAGSKIMGNLGKIFLEKHSEAVPRMGGNEVVPRKGGIENQPKPGPKGLEPKMALRATGTLRLEQYLNGHVLPEEDKLRHNSHAVDLASLRPRPAPNSGQENQAGETPSRRVEMKPRVQEKGDIHGEPVRKEEADVLSLIRKDPKRIYLDKRFVIGELTFEIRNVSEHGIEFYVQSDENARQTYYFPKVMVEGAASQFEGTVLAPGSGYSGWVVVPGIRSKKKLTLVFSSIGGETKKEGVRIEW